MMPFKRPAADKSGIPVYPPGATATTYQQLMQLQHPFVPVSCEYQTATSISTTQASQPQYLPSTTTNNAVVNPIIANNNNLNNNIMSIKNNNIMNSNPSETFTTITTTCNANAVAGIITSTTPTTSLTTSPSSMTSSNINSVENNINNVVNVNVPVTIASKISCSSNSNDNINVNGGVINTETTNENTTTTINTNGTDIANEVTNPATNTNTESADTLASSTSSALTVDSPNTANAYESQENMDNNNNTNSTVNVAAPTISSFENGTTQQTHTTPSYSISHYQGAPAAFSYALPTSQTTYTNSIPQQQQFNATYSYPHSALAAAYGNYYQDPAAIAKEVAQKNYALKLAASSNAFAGKSLTAYAGMAALNKPLMSQQLTATPTGLRVAPQSAATGAPQSFQNPFAQRPVAANYYQQLQAAQAQYLRPQINPFAAAVAQQQLLIPQQQMQPQFFQYPGMIPGVAANTYSYGIPMSAAGAVQTSSTPIAQVTSMQQPAATTNSAVVLNPYKKMKTS